MRDRLLGLHETELGRISELLAADGIVGSQVHEKLAAVRQREQELRAVETTRAELEERMKSFSGIAVSAPTCCFPQFLSWMHATHRWSGPAGKGGGVMLKLDELSSEVASLEALHSNLAMLERMRKLEEETDAWVRLQQLAELLKSPECCGVLQSTVRVSLGELLCELRISFTDDVAAAAKDLGWPKVIEIPPSLQHSADGTIADWIRPQTPGVTPGDTRKKPSNMQRLEHFCRALARLTTLQLIALDSQEQPSGDADFPSARRGEAHECAIGEGGGARSRGFYLDVWGVDCLLSALDVRFKFHFRSGRKTNRLDKPDWCVFVHCVFVHKPSTCISTITLVASSLHLYTNIYHHTRISHFPPVQDNNERRLRNQGFCGLTPFPPTP